MKNWFLVCLITIVSFLGVMEIAQASLIVYRNQTDFLANAGSTAVYDFESDSAFYISPKNSYGGVIGSVHDFGDFSIDSTSTGIYSSEVRDLSGNKDIYVITYNNSASLNVILDNDVRAFGFNYVVAGNDDDDNGKFSLMGNTWDLGANGTSGFFGIVEDAGTIAAGTAFSFGQQSTSWSGLSFDNITYSSNGNSPVPEPATMLLFGFGLLSLAGVSRRKK